MFGEWLCDIAEQDPRIVAITPAMREGSGLVEFEQRFPDRYFDVAIAEQHAVTLAAGLACDGLRPVVAIYSTFLQRAYDQLIHDVALQRLPVVFAIDRAGLVGGDGATHQGDFDLSFLRCVPNLVVMAPADENECRQMLYTAVTLDQPAAVRYPRGRGPGVAVESTMQALPLGRAEMRRRGGSGLALLAFGTMVAPAAAVAEVLDATVVNMRFVKPLDEELIAAIAAEHRAIVTLEENVVAGGAGSAVLEFLQRIGSGVPVLQIGVPDGFVEHGSREDNLLAAGLDANSVRAVDRPLLAQAGHVARRCRPANQDRYGMISIADHGAGPPEAGTTDERENGGRHGHPDHRDVQGRADTRRIPIDRVGIKDIYHPVRVKDRSGGEQHTIANFNMYVPCPTTSRARTCRASSRS